MIDLNKLNELKDMDAAQLGKLVVEHRDVLIKVLLIAVSLIVLMGIFSAHNAQDQAMRLRISHARQNAEAVKNRDSVNQDIKDFKASFSKDVSDSDLIVLISKYAQLNHIVITSLSPAENKDMGSFDTVNLSFEALSDNFRDLMLFLRKIERADAPLRIDSWSGSEKDDGRITFLIKVSAILVHP